MIRLSYHQVSDYLNRQWAGILQFYFRCILPLPAPGRHPNFIFVVYIVNQSSLYKDMVNEEIEENHLAC